METEHIASTLDTARSQASINGRYPLHDAIAARDIASLQRLVGKDDTDLELANMMGVKPLFLATNLGYREAVNLLLYSGVEIEAPVDIHRAPEIIALTALQRAVELNFEEIAEALLQHGADVNSRNANNETPLLVAVKNRAPEMVQLLLRYGADKYTTDAHGVAEDYGQGSDQMISLLQEPQLLQGPLPLGEQGHRMEHRSARRYEPPTPDLHKMTALHGYRAAVVDFFVDDKSEERIEKSVSVYELLYGKQDVIQAPLGIDRRGNQRNFRWYHLPANNIEWVETLVNNRVLKSRALSDEFKSAAGLTGSYDRSYSSAANPSAFMRPTAFTFHIDPEGNQVDCDHIAAFIPYLHFETHSNFESVSISSKEGVEKIRNWAALQRRKDFVPDRQNHAKPEWPVENPQNLYKHLLEGYYFRQDFPMESAALQIRRTLDQYFYAHYDTEIRDQDQVVYRYFRDVLHSEEPKMFMVDQLWLWVLGRGTILGALYTLLT
ncbi:hypothetical protein GGR57DRAFT_438740 [Xylariaceae sp. FL1272]|nr:hypothetical protein GGR57DRAFT_438740 [Xylariaceae sp. FL1272]